MLRTEEASADPVLEGREEDRIAELLAPDDAVGQLGVVALLHGVGGHPFVAGVPPVVQAVVGAGTGVEVDTRKVAASADEGVGALPLILGQRRAEDGAAVDVAERRRGALGVAAGDDEAAQTPGERGLEARDVAAHDAINHLVAGAE